VLQALNAKAAIRRRKVVLCVAVKMMSPWLNAQSHNAAPKRAPAFAC
jgi:hypothetical protein